MNIAFRIIIFIPLFFATVTALCQATFKDLSVNEFADKLKTENVLIIDVRTADELKAGVIGKPLHIDFLGADFETRIARLDRNKNYLVYCASGYRSGEALKLMEQLKFTSVYNLPSGITGWKRAGKPVNKF